MDCTFFGTGRPLVVAGPCSAESRDQVMRTACALKEAGVNYFRAGAWKPRTHPGSFEGVGEKALRWIRQAGDEYGLKVCVEVASERHVHAALDCGIDFLWIGARTTANPFLVQEVAEALASTDIPILVKNPLSPDLDLWIGAVERLRRCGIKDIGVVYRGVTPSRKLQYRNDPHWNLAIDFRLRFPDMVMFCDPSHIGGDRRFVAEISQKALDLDFDGLFIESHICPDDALSDASQQVTPARLGQLLSSLTPKDRTCDDRSCNESIEQLRAKIDDIDENILALLAERQNVSAAIGEFKRRNNISVFQGARWDAVLEHVATRAEEFGLDKDFVRDVYSLIHCASIDRQTK